MEFKAISKMKITISLTRSRSRIFSASARFFDKSDIVMCNNGQPSIRNYTTVRPLLSAVLGRAKFWSQKPIIEVRL